MGVSTVHTIERVAINGSGAATIKEIDESTLDPNIDLFVANAAGDYRASYASIMQQNPRVDFACLDISTVLDLTGILSLAIPTSTTYTSIDVWLAKMAEAGTRAGASSHPKVRINEGMLIPLSITASQNQPAKINCAVIATYDGTNNPFAYSTGQSLPSVLNFDQAHTLGPISFNGTVQNGIESVTIDFGLEIIVQASSGEVWPTFCGILRGVPFIDYTSLDVPDWLTMTLTGTAQSSTDSVVYLTAMTENSVRAGSGSHISFTMDDGINIPRTVGGSNNQPARAGFRLQPTFDGTNSVLVYAKNATLP